MNTINIKLSDLLRINPISTTKNVSNLFKTISTKTKPYFRDFHNKFSESIEEISNIVFDFNVLLHILNLTIIQTDLQFLFIYVLQLRLNAEVYSHELYFFVILLKKVYENIFFGNLNTKSNNLSTQEFLYDSNTKSDSMKNELLSIYKKIDMQHNNQINQTQNKVFLEQFELVPQIHLFLKRLLGNKREEISKVLDYTAYFVCERYCLNALNEPKGKKKILPVKSQKS